MSAAISETPLTAVIKNTIGSAHRKGMSDEGKELSAIPFHQYMMLCLYHPEFGYYRSGSTRVGRDGDFYTSSYIGELMGEQLASEISRLAKQWFADAEAVEVIDWGGGTGRLSRQMLDAWKGSETRNFRLTLVEGNPVHRHAAQEELAGEIEFGIARIIGSDEGESLTFETNDPVVIVANELLDAFPIYRLTQRNGKLLEWGVSWSDEQGLFSCLMEPVEPRLKQWIEAENIVLLDNQTIELNLDAADWVTNLTSRLRRAILLFIDYGDETEELMSEHRMDGTLLCYREHRAHNDPYAVPGEQDLTAHVNYSHIRRAALAAGCRELWYGTQKSFLLESGVLGKLSSHAITDPFHPIVRRNRAIRQLLLSDGMSELFKVQVLLKDE
ncbi:class I SAM-dependent methyltransferase [Cohnella herbarum]|uniref:SAM-dependent methyltransferase n=1 Tax=Cohnella herbarum TaxID=2728023 RepID=A0A7Z2ZL87_9BACL|nr:SAM-dependent methyltransferase [Cohnella herbarum]QJD83614.1 SAM-dependent methyltransferase [Cohnella herbarum]